MIKLISILNLICNKIKNDILMSNQYPNIWSMRNFKTFDFAITCYEKSKIVANEKQKKGDIFLSCFTNHKIPHVELVIKKTEEIARLLSIINKKDIKTLKISALYHDTGMDGDFLYETDGKEIRKKHPLNSVKHIFENKELFKLDGINPDFVAAICILHSKSSSGVEDLTNNDLYVNDQNLIQNRYLEYLSREEKNDYGEKITFFELNYCNDYPPKGSLYENKDSNGRYIEYDDAKIFKERIENYKKRKPQEGLFSFLRRELISYDRRQVENELEKLKLFAAVLRLADSLGHRFNMKNDEIEVITQSDDIIKIDIKKVGKGKPENYPCSESYYQDFAEAHFFTDDIFKDINGNYFHFFDNPFEEYCNFEIQNLCSNFKKEEYDIKQCSYKIYVGEGNIEKMDIEKTGDKLELKILIRTTYAPFCTIRAIVERLEEIKTFKSEKGTTLIDIETKLIFLNIEDETYNVYDEFFNNQHVINRYGKIAMEKYE